MISALNIQPAVADQILTFLGVLEAAKDPAAVKKFLAELQAQREGIANAERGLYDERQAVLAARAEAVGVLAAADEAEARKEQVFSACAQEQQRVSDARDEVERFRVEVRDARAAWLLEVSAANVQRQRHVAAANAQADELAAREEALAEEQRSLDARAADLEAREADLAARTKALRALLPAAEKEDRA